MNQWIASTNRLTLVVITTLCCIFISLTIQYFLYNWLAVEMRPAEIGIGILAPLLIASAVTWYLFGLIKKLEKLEIELRHSISKEKEEVYLATINGAQHITNNLLNGLTLVDMEIRNHPTFNQEAKAHFNELRTNSKTLMQQLSSVDEIHPDKIRKAVAP